MNSSELLDAAAALVAAARRHGADSAEAAARVETSESVGVRLGVLEDVSRSSGTDVALRAFVGARSASVSSADLSRGAIEELAARAVAMARLAPEDPFAGLVPVEALATGTLPDLALADPAERTPEALRDTASAVEDAARAVTGVTNSEGGSATAVRGVSVLVTSTGFARAVEGTFHAVSASVIAGEGAAMQRDHAGRSARWLHELPSPEDIGRLAGERAAARLDPGALSSGPMTVVFDPRVSASLVGHLLGAMSAPAIARRASFLASREGEALFAPAVQIVEDPLRPRGARSRAFDGEGVACAPRVLVENGHVTGWLTNRASAAQLGLRLTGHAARGGGVTTGNVDLLPGVLSPAELIADISDGVIVDYLIGQGVNSVTGDYSRGAAGRRIVNGRIEAPVAGFTIAGNLLSMFASMTPASDLETWRGINAPTLRVEGMTVAGG